MRITIYPESGGTPMVIANGVSPSGTELLAPSELDVDHDFSEQIVEFLRGEEVQVFDRGNHRTNIAFTVYNEADDQMGNNPNDRYARAATDMFEAHRYCVKGVIAIEGYFEGQVGIRYYMRGVVKCRAKHVAGITFALSFNIIGGKLSTTIPAGIPSP